VTLIQSLQTPRMYFRLGREPLTISPLLQRLLTISADCLPPFSFSGVVDCRRTAPSFFFFRHLSSVRRPFLVLFPNPRFVSCRFTARFGALYREAVCSASVSCLGILAAFFFEIFNPPVLSVPVRCGRLFVGVTGPARFRSHTPCAELAECMSFPSYASCSAFGIFLPLSIDMNHDPRVSPSECGRCFFLELSPRLVLSLSLYLIPSREILAGYLAVFPGRIARKHVFSSSALFPDLSLQVCPPFYPPFESLANEDLFSRLVFQRLFRPMAFRKNSQGRLPLSGACHKY